MSKSRSSDEKDKEKEKDKEVDSETEKEKECEKDAEKEADVEHEGESEREAVKDGSKERNRNEDDTEENAKGQNVQLPVTQLQLDTDPESNLKSPVFDSNSLMVRNEPAIPSSPPPSYEHVIEQVRIRAAAKYTISSFPSAFASSSF